MRVTIYIYLLCTTDSFRQHIFSSDDDNHLTCSKKYDKKSDGHYEHLNTYLYLYFKIIIIKGKIDPNWKLKQTEASPPP